MPTVHTIATTVHGRYLIQDSAAPRLLLVGCHGYGENAADHFERLTSIPGVEGCLVVSIQALHRFYNRRTQRVIASWMTREDRELAIADNVAYVNRVIEAVAGARPDLPLVFTGFSQGVAMAFRAACASPRPVSAVVSMGGDVPPELDRSRLSALRRVLVGRGTRDEWYTAAKLAADLSRLRDAGVDATAVEIDAGHEWPGSFSASVGRFLTLAS